MARDRKDLGARKFVRVDLRKPGFLIPAPDAPWIECYILDISENGASLDVGDLAVPRVFGLSLTAGGEVRRVCTLIWRRGELVGVRFVSARKLRNGVAPPSEPDAASRKAHA
ncbi:PilZ domain-containing protein [Bradyrhizobium sp. 157]|uniref:PilZ domain-containing protein n=1 Tax=Bradyrhizobium sp. 157 TaxID=2782631 RepID=UPI001FFBC755|nr:PilZ domain-containing protein [Bradyrhizobium sp. 157]MCK1642687.1 PilZ domain-containing protein [Bradyrhizobium sp. 157]